MPTKLRRSNSLKYSITNLLSIASTLRRLAARMLNENAYSITVYNCRLLAQ